MIDEVIGQIDSVQNLNLKSNKMGGPSAKKDI